MNRSILSSIESEYGRYKALGEAAIGQLSHEELSASPLGGNSVATLVWHIAGNLESRFTEFLTADGEKPWRHRETEFEPRDVGREELLARWDDGFGTLLSALASLTDADLGASVKIRGESLEVGEALHRSLAHTSYHVGQIVYVGRGFKGADWTYLSIPPGGSEAYNRDPSLEKPSAHAASMKAGTDVDHDGMGRGMPRTTARSGTAGSPDDDTMGERSNDSG